MAATVQISSGMQRDRGKCKENRISDARVLESVSISSILISTGG